MNSNKDSVFDTDDDIYKRAMDTILNDDIIYEMISAEPSSSTHRENEYNEIARLPEPNVVLFPPEQVKLGWQENKSSVGSGLDNTGVICYINSTLQAIFHVPAFVNWLMNDEQHRMSCQQKNGYQNKCTICMVRETYMISQILTGFSYKATMITNNLHLICKHLSTHRQEDAHEFLRYLMDSMEQCYLSVLEHAKYLDVYSKETTPINQIFGGYIRTEITCGKCRHKSTSFQHYEDFSLDIKQSDDINHALDNYFEKESLDKFTCHQCQTKVVAEKRFYIEKAPNVLCIQLKRYDVDNRFSRSKNLKEIQLDERLDLSKYQFDNHPAKIGHAQPLRYHLVSMVMHHGISLNSGHYTALGVTPSGSYYYYNDSIVYQSGFHNYKSSNDAYILFYELDPFENANKANLERDKPILTSSMDTSCVPTVSGLYSNMGNDDTELIKDSKGKKSQLHDELNSNIIIIRKDNGDSESRNEKKLEVLDTYKISDSCEEKRSKKRHRSVEDEYSESYSNECKKISLDINNYYVDKSPTYVKTNENNSSMGNTWNESSNVNSSHTNTYKTQLDSGDAKTCNSKISFEAEEKENRGIKRSYDEDFDGEVFKKTRQIE